MDCYSGLVDDIDHDSDIASVGTVVDVDHSADFKKSLEDLVWVSRVTGVSLTPMLGESLYLLVDIDNLLIIMYIENQILPHLNCIYQVIHP